MKKYARISASFTYDAFETGLKDDHVVTEAVNKKLDEFLKKTKPESFNIVNTETKCFDNDDKFTAVYFVYLHIEYQV